MCEQYKARAVTPYSKESYIKCGKHNWTGIGANHHQTKAVRDCHLYVLLAAQTKRCCKQVYKMVTQQNA